MEILRLDEAFFHRDALEVAPELVGKVLARRLENGTVLKARLTETEAYRGEEDGACHARKGLTDRTRLLYGKSGIIYVYLIYGLHWLMNVITGEEGQPQGVLLRCSTEYPGPARLTKALYVDREMNGQPICNNPAVWIEDDGYRPALQTAPRVGVDYAPPEWRDKPWRYIADTV